MSSPASGAQTPTEDSTESAQPDTEAQTSSPASGAQTPTEDSTESAQPDTEAQTSSPASGAQTPTEDSTESAQPDAVQPRHRRLGTVGLTALLVCVVFGAAAGITAWLTHGFQGAVTVRYHQAAVFSAQVGDCINLTPNGTVVHVVPCAGAHDAEVFGTFHLSGDKWPGTAAIRQEASSGCASRLAGYLNPQLAAADLAQSYVYPGQQAWDAGGRTVVCEVRSTSGQLTGSVRSGSLVSGGS